MIQQKKCKGQNKAKGFDGCGKPVDAKKRRYGLCTSCYADFILNTDVGRVLLEKATLKATKSRREYEAFEKEEKERKSLPRELQLTQVVFNTYIRERDKYKPCASSLAHWKPDFDAGHIFPVKQYSALRFDEDNCHGQSVGDNRFKEGNVHDYLINIKHRIGQERLDALIKRAEESKKTFKKWSIEELKEIRKHYSEKLKELKNGTSS